MLILKKAVDINASIIIGTEKILFISASSRQNLKFQAENFMFKIFKM